MRLEFQNSHHTKGYAISSTSFFGGFVRIREIRCRSSDTAATLFSKLEKRVHLVKLSCCLGLWKSFRFSFVSGSGLFKQSFLVVKCLKTLTTIIFADFACHSYLALRNIENFVSVGTLRF